jgi:pimeloyl-ACP methyl ester carboxylesterase
MRRNPSAQYAPAQILGGWAAGAIAAIAIGMVGCASTLASTPAFVGIDGAEVEGSIATIETVVLGGVEQRITIRGVDASNPVLLYLHGGPGLPSSPWASWRSTFETLEESFVLIHWDQRGSGFSFHPDLTADQMHVENFVSDTLELTRILSRRFGQQRIFLWGHSFGAGIGFEVLRADPSPFLAYFASGVRPSWDESQTAGFEMLLDLAGQSGDEKAVAELTAIEPFDPSNPEHREVRGKYLSRFLVGDFHTEKLEGEWFDYARKGRSPEYPRSTVRTVIAGLNFSRETIGKEAVESGFDLYRDFPVSTIPVHFFAGRYDYETPAELAYDYFEALVAPAKSFTLLEDSAHNPMYDEPETFGRTIAEISRETIGEAE